jgi:hypothetical protein
VEKGKEVGGGGGGVKALLMFKLNTRKKENLYLLQLRMMSNNTLAKILHIIIKNISNI